MKKFKIALISSSEKELLSAIEEENRDENNLWRIPNLVIPLATVFLGIIGFFLLGGERFVLIRYFNIIINGSLPLIAINQISATGVHIFKYNREQEKQYGNDTFMLRTKLFWFSIGVLAISVLLFAAQVISNPFVGYLELSIQLFFSITLLILSSHITRRLFLLQGDLLEKTFYKDMKVEVDHNKSHLENKYGN